MKKTYFLIAFELLKCVKQTTYKTVNITSLARY